MGGRGDSRGHDRWQTLMRSLVTLTMTPRELPGKQTGKQKRRKVATRDEKERKRAEWREEEEPSACERDAQRVLTSVGSIPARALRRDLTAWKTSTTSSVSALSKRLNSAQNSPVC